MGQGSYVICEWDSVARSEPKFQQAFAALEQKAINQCNMTWGKSFNLRNTYSTGDNGYGRTTILPGAFNSAYGIGVATGYTNANGVAGVGSGVALTTWRQAFTAAFIAANPNQFVLLSGAGAGNTVPEGLKVALAGFAFPNKQQHITEIKMQIGDRKYGRFNLEEMLIYNKPAIIFEEGIVIDEENGFDIYAHFDGTVPTQIGNWTTTYQRVVPIGALYYQSYQKVGGAVGTPVPLT